MKAVSGKRLADLAEVHGWRLARIKGSHHMYVKSGRTETPSIPLHGNQVLKIGMQAKLMKILGIPKDEL